MEQCFIGTGQTDQGFIDGHIAVRMDVHSLSHHVSALGTGTVHQSHLVHGIQDFPMSGFEAVDFGDRAGHDHAHNVRHIVLFYGIGDELILYRSNHLRRGLCLDFFPCHSISSSSRLFDMNDPSASGTDQSIIQCQIPAFRWRKLYVHTGIFQIIRLAKNGKQCAGCFLGICRFSAG